MLTLKEIQETITRYDGRHLYVRCKNKDASQHSGRAKLIGVVRGMVEIQPHNHKKTEVVDPATLTWWTSEMRFYHPDFRADGDFYLFDGHSFNGPGGFDADFQGALVYRTARGVKTACSILSKKHSRSISILTREQAIVVNQKLTVAPLEVSPVVPSDRLEDLRAAWHLVCEAMENMFRILEKK